MASYLLPVAEAVAIDRSPVEGPSRHNRARKATTQDHPEWLRTRRQLRRATARLIAERGVLKASPRAIIRAARLPGLVLTDCYPNRQALLADIMLHHLDGLTCWVLAARDAAGKEGAAAQLEAMIGAYLASSLAERNEHRLLLRAADVLEEREQEQVRLRCNGLAALFADTLKQTVPDASDAALTLASLTLVSALSCAVLWFDPDGRIAIAGYAQMLAGMTMEGVQDSAPAFGNQRPFPARPAVSQSAGLAQPAR
jgi:AcrR family transcriptional regulator